MSAKEKQQIVAESLGGGAVKLDKKKKLIIVAGELKDEFEKEEEESSPEPEVQSSNVTKNSNVDVVEISVRDTTITKYNFGKNMVYKYGKEFVCILAIILTTCATFQNIPPKITRPPTPRPFFSQSSLVHDSFTGCLVDAQHRVQLSELALVFYYAPWCAQSQHARHVYENAAQYYYRDVHFGAINCWQPGGECRMQYAKVQSWPVLMAYFPNGLAVQYHGAWTNSGVIRFIRSLLSPVQRFTTPDNLLAATVGCDAVVVAYVNVDTHKSQYLNFFKTTVRWLERDPYQEISFGVVTGESAILFGVTELPTIRMYLWNETIEYTGNSSWTQVAINSWIVEHIQQVSLWLAPPGTKSTSLAPYLKQGPVLLLFTHRNLYSDSIDAYNMIRQIGLEYYNCPQDEWVKEMARDYISQQRIENHEKFLELQSKCDALLKSQQQSCKCLDKSVSYVNVLNSSKLGSQDFQQDNDFCEVSSTVRPYQQNERDSCKQNANKVCNDMGPKRTPAFLQHHNKFKTSKISNEMDPRSVVNLRESKLKQTCELLRMSDLESPTQFFNPHEDSQSLAKVSGMACQMNRTFSLITIDSLLYHTFAERLGIDILTIQNKSVALIIDNESESTYRLNGEISVRTLTDFMSNYKRRALKRFMRSDSVQYKHTHFYSALEEQLQHERSRAKQFNKTTNINRNSRKITIQEIFSETFEEEVIRSNKTVITLFHSSQCALCGIMSQNLLTLSNMLRDLTNLKFVMIDGDKNDLSWFYTMTQFPSLVIFPGDNKSESRLFPTSFKVNLQNILGFILSNLNRPSRFYAMILSCRLSMKMIFLNGCLERLHHEISDNISYSLREWRRVPHARRNILRRLQILKTMYLELYKINHSCDVVNLESNAKYLMQLWTSNYEK